MIGYDRPLRPRWIYETLLLAKPGQKLGELNKPFESIATELTGKEGKRKARTVLFRCFLRDDNNETRVKDPLVLKDLSRKYGLEFMKPVYLFYLVAKTGVLLQLTNHLFRLYYYGRPVNQTFLAEKMVDSFGERDVVKRSARSFVQTLHHFGVITNTGKQNIFKAPLHIEEEQLRIMLQLFALEITGSPQVSLDQLNSSLMQLFQGPDLRQTAQKYNGIYWDYRQQVKDDIITVYTMRPWEGDDKVSLS